MKVWRISHPCPPSKVSVVIDHRHEYKTRRANLLHSISCRLTRAPISPSPSLVGHFAMLTMLTDRSRYPSLRPRPRVDHPSHAAQDRRRPRASSHSRSPIWPAARGIDQPALSIPHAYPFTGHDTLAYSTLRARQRSRDGSELTSKFFRQIAIMQWQNRRVFPRLMTGWHPRRHGRWNKAQETWLCAAWLPKIKLALALALACWA